MRCDCGFKFSGPGELRNCEAFIADNGDSGVICPRCGDAYVSGRKVKGYCRNESTEVEEKE